jgi:hypothetical protein
MSTPTVDIPPQDGEGDVADGLLCLSSCRVGTPPADHFPGRIFVIQKTTEPSDEEFINDGVFTLLEDSPIGDITWSFEQEIGVDTPPDDITLWYKHTWFSPEFMGGDPGLMAGEIWASTGSATVDFTVNSVEFCEGSSLSGGDGADPIVPEPTTSNPDIVEFNPAVDDSVASRDNLPSARIGDFVGNRSARLESFANMDSRVGARNRRASRAIVPYRDGDWLIYLVPAAKYISWLNLNRTASLRARTLDVCVDYIDVTSNRDVRREKDWPRSPVSVTSTQGFGLIKARKKENWLFIGEPQYSVCIWQGFRQERTPIFSQSRQLPTRVNVDICQDIFVDFNHQRGLNRVGYYVLSVRVVD